MLLIKYKFKLSQFNLAIAVAVNAFLIEHNYCLKLGCLSHSSLDLFKHKVNKKKHLRQLGKGSISVVIYCNNR